MDGSEDQDHEVDERLIEPTSFLHPQNLNQHSTPIRVMGLHPGWQSKFPTKSQQVPPHFDCNQNYANMAYYQPNFEKATYPNMYFQQTVRPPPLQTTQPMFDQPLGPPQHQNTQPPMFQQFIGRPPQHPNTQPMFQPIGSPQNQTTQSTVNMCASEYSNTTPPATLKGNTRGNKNWRKEEDIQLTTAWLRVSTDPIVGVGQKRETLYERILKLFVNLMHEHHQMKPEDCTRTAHALDNRMGEIKSQCSRWTATRAQVLGSYKSGWSPEDIEKLCLEIHKGQGKGTFKWKECWEILRESPKWNDYLDTKLADDSQSTARKRAKRTQPSSEPQMEPQLGESIPNDTTDPMDSYTPCTPSISSTCSDPESSSTYQWEKLGEENRIRDQKDEERLDNMKRKHDRHIDLEHDMKVGNERSTLVQDIAVIGEKLIAAIQLLDQMDPLSLVTSNQRRLYELRKKAVDNFENQYAALEDLLSRSKIVSAPSALEKENIESDGFSQRHNFDENEVCLGQDSPR